MSDARLPDRIDPIRLAEARRRLNGELAIAALPRFATLLKQTTGTVRVAITCGVDEEGIRFMQGRLETQVSLECQRCLEDFAASITADFALGIIGDESEAERLPEHYEPLVVGEEPVYLRDVVEDELILSLPIVPKHPEGQCPMDKHIGRQPEENEAAREHPFAALRDLTIKREP